MIPSSIKIYLYSLMILIPGLLSLSSCSRNSQKQDETETLLNNLDLQLAKKKQFEQAKKEKIANLKNGLHANRNNDSLAYDLNRHIIEEYLGYQCDSAFNYLDHNLALARKTQNGYWLMETALQNSVLLSTTGLFSESAKILQNIKKEELPENLRFAYNSSYECFYSNLLDYNGENGRFSSQYRQKLKDYYAKAYESLPPDNQFAYLFKSNQYRINGEYREAEVYIDKFLKTTEPGTRLNAIGSYCKAVIDGKLGKINEQEKHLIVSAISDLKSSTKENRSMQELAEILYKKGDEERAFRYIQSALEDANFYNARFRSIQISKVQPIIEKTYLMKINRQNEKLRLSVIIISILFIGLGFTVYFIYQQLQTIAKSRNELSEVNRNLTLVNHKLDEANHIKEEYIAYFINQCSIYLERFDHYKKLISRRLAMGQMDKLSQMVNKKKNDVMDLDELYKNFDTAFLRIYPNFVEEFNRLLKPGEEYILKSGTLNTELRIFALIRLGINDSGQISEFLRYSLRTIYNYRSKMRAKSVIENDDFEAKIMQIGSVSAK